MPPKKKDKGKGGDKAGSKKGKGSANKASKVQDDGEVNRDFYNVQIKDLEHRLERYQHRCDELAVKNGQFNEKFEHLESEKRNIVDFLKKSLQDKGNEVQDLNDRLVGLQQAKDQEKEQYQSELQKLRTDFQEMKDQLTSENMILGGKLASLEEFKVQREDLMEKMKALEDSLVEKEQEHGETIYKLEKKQVIDKDRLKKEMVSRVNQVAAEFRKVSNKQMAETTKRTIRENVSINAQLAKMSDKTMELIQENDELKNKEKKHKQQLEMLEENEKALAKKNHSNLKIVRMLTEKCRAQETMLAEYEVREESYQELEAEADLLRQQVESVREELQMLDTENRRLDETHIALEKERNAAVQEKVKLETILQEAAIAIRNTLLTQSPEDVEESEQDEREKREVMLENLLILLNSAASVGLTEGMSSPTPKRPGTTLLPGSGGLKKGDFTPSVQIPTSLTHYQLGDLGLIPRPQQHIPSSLERMKELSATTRMGRIPKPQTRSVATQTISTPKTMFYADQLLSKVTTGDTLLHNTALPPISGSGSKLRVK